MEFTVDIVWQSEDSLCEKKLESDLKDLLKTLVAFANSVSPGDTARIFIGEEDDGLVQGVSNADNIQKRVKKEADRIYPEIYFKTEVYEREGKECVRVDIRHNGLAPHFGGAAWVRRGSETIKATEQLYELMVALRQDKIRVLSQWLKKTITIEGTKSKAFIADPHSMLAAEWSVGTHQATLESVNIHWATFNVHGSTTHSYDKSEPMEKLLLSWDDEKSRLKVVVKNWPK
jgi:hypothetical protein